MLCFSSTFLLDIWELYIYLFVDLLHFNWLIFLLLLLLLVLGGGGITVVAESLFEGGDTLLEVGEVVGDGHLDEIKESKCLYTMVECSCYGCGLLLLLLGFL